MKEANFKLITIVCEPVLSKSVIELTRKMGASGFTLADVRGEGSGEKSSGEIPDDKVKIELVTKSAIATQIMAEVSKVFFKDYSLIIYSSDIQIMRPDKF